MKHHWPDSGSGLAPENGMRAAKLLKTILRSLACLVCLLHIHVSSAFAADLEPEIDPLFGLEHESRNIADEFVLNWLNPLAWPLILMATHSQGIHPGPLTGAGLGAIWFNSLVGFSSFMTGQAAILGHARAVEKDPSLPYRVENGRLVNPADGFWIEPGYDFSVVETRSAPSTVGTYEDNEKMIKALLFTPLRNFGLVPAWHNGGGQYHLDAASAFRDDPQLLRDFIVDALNHPGLFVGGMGKAVWLPPISRRYLQAVKDVVDQFDRGEIREFYPLFQAFNEAGLQKVKGPPLALRQINGSKTIEFRSFRAQRSYKEMIAMMKLIKARLNYLKSNPGVEWLNQPRSHIPAISDGQFRSYVETCGLDWKDYRGFLPLWRQLFLATGDLMKPSRSCQATVGD